MADPHSLTLSITRYFFRVTNVERFDSVHLFSGLVKVFLFRAFFVMSFDLYTRRQPVHSSSSLVSKLRLLLPEIPSIPLFVRVWSIGFRSETALEELSF